MCVSWFLLLTCNTHIYLPVEQKGAEVAPTIISWKHVAVLGTKDFETAQKMTRIYVPGNWVPDKWSRGGKVAYKGEPKCAWRRRMSKDGKQIVRLIQYKNIWILQKAVMLGAKDEKQQEEQGEKWGCFLLNLFPDVS